MADEQAVIVGETTFGKGLVQQLQKIGNGGSKIKYTIGKYYTPSGRCIQSKTYASAGPGSTGTKAEQVPHLPTFTSRLFTCQPALSLLEYLGFSDPGLSVWCF